MQSSNVISGTTQLAKDYSAACAMCGDWAPCRLFSEIGWLCAPCVAAIRAKIMRVEVSDELAT